MSQDKILAVKEDYFGRVIFNNPEKHNAVSHAMWIALAKTMEAFDADDDVRVIVLEGSGDRAFVSGADISKFESERANAERIKEYGIAVNQGYESVQHALKPTIAKIRGYCYGGGMGIAICCDLRICSDDSTFCVPASKLGVGYGHENTKVLLDLVGPSFAKEIFYTGRRFDAAEAGFDDEFLYNEIPLEPGQRQMTTEQYLRDEAVVAFEEWKRLEDKIEY